MDADAPDIVPADRKAPNKDAPRGRCVRQAAVATLLASGCLFGAAPSANESPQSTPDSRDVSAQATLCGWQVTGDQISNASGELGTTVKNATAKFRGWWLSAVNLTKRGAAAVGPTFGATSASCRLTGSGRVRILAPDGRYITGASFAAEGSPASWLSVWPAGSNGTSTSVIGDGWRVHGRAVFSEVMTGEIRIDRPGVSHNSAPGVVQSRRESTQ